MKSRTPSPSSWADCAGRHGGALRRRLRALSDEAAHLRAERHHGLDNPDCDYTAKDITHDDAMCFSLRARRARRGAAARDAARSRPSIALNALGVTPPRRGAGLTGEKIARGLGAFAGGTPPLRADAATIEGVKLFTTITATTRRNFTRSFRWRTPLRRSSAVCRLPAAHLFPHQAALRSIHDLLYRCGRGAHHRHLRRARKGPRRYPRHDARGRAAKHGVPAVYTPDFDACENYLRTHWQPGDVMISLGCGQHQPSQRADCPTRG